MMRKFKFLIIMTVICILSFVVWMVDYARTPLNISPSSQEITIKPNSSLRSIAQQLETQGVIPNAWSFVLLAKALHKEAYLQAGEYTLNKNVTPYQLLLSLNHGKTTQGSITFIEGHTFKQMQQRIAKNDALKHTIKNLSNEEFMHLLGSDIKNPEGLFFPDTYYFDRNAEDIVVLKRAHTIMQNKLEKAWQERAQGLPYKNSYEALIMASIIEKETGKASERKMIAGVFINRLRIGMRLQTDPTVIYGMGEKFDGNIRRKDLLKDTIYNTYTRSGLPPTPIAMPGLAAIEAALHPEKTSALYFVGKGDGSHAFSSSLSEHNRAVIKYQLKK
jgi:UPF0755 protein